MAVHNRASQYIEIVQELAHVLMLYVQLPTLIISGLDDPKRSNGQQ